jgi:enterobacteria phage integrase
VPRKVPKYCERFRDRHGKLRLYFRKSKGPRIALPADVESDEFREVYANALLGLTKQKPKLDAPGTIGALIQSYYSSPEFIELRETTKAGYRSRIELIRAAHAHRTLSGMTREGIVTKVLQPYADRPGQRLSILKTFRVLIRHAISIGWLNHDPSLGIRRPKTQEIRAWTEAEIAQFEARWPPGSKQRLAFALMLYTGQRRSDVHRMTWADVNGDAIRVTQQKTGAKLTIPIHSRLMAALSEARRDHVTVLNTEFGKPFTVDGFSSFMRAAITAAGLPLACQPHGLRKAAGRRLAEAGCTARQIMAILGHKTLSEAERYTREADQAELATAAILKLEARNVNKTPKPPNSGLGKTRKRQQNQGD